MGVVNKEVKFRVYQYFGYKSANIPVPQVVNKPYMQPRIEGDRLLDAGKYVYVFRTSKYGDVYHYATYRITEQNKNNKFEVPFSDFGTKVKCYFIVADFSLNINYIEALRLKLKNLQQRGTILQTSVNNRFTYGELRANYEEWLKYKQRHDSYTKNHIVYNQNDDCSIVYLYDYSFLTKKYRRQFDRNLDILKNFYGGGDPQMKVDHGDGYFEKRELGKLVTGVCDNLDKWDMLENDGVGLKSFVKEVDDAQERHYQTLGVSARILITWLRSPGFSSYIEDYDYHDKKTSDILIPLIDDLDKVASGRTYTIQEIIRSIEDYKKLKDIPALRDSGAISNAELGQMIENDVKYSSLLSLTVKGVKEVDTKFRDICKAVSNLFYTTEQFLPEAEKFTQIVFKYKWGINIVFREVDIVKEFTPDKSAFVVDPSGAASKARLIKLEKANWLKLIKDNKTVFDNIEKAMIVINFAICTYKLCDMAMKGNASTAKQITTIASFVKATSDMLKAFVFKEIAQKAGTEAVRNAAKTASCALAWVSAIINVGSYTYKTIEDINQMDYDAAVGSGMIALGSVGTGLISVGILSAKTGVGLIVLLIGAILVIAGVVIKIFCDDDTIDDYLKECQWGKYSRDKKVNYNDFQKQLDRFYKIIVDYNITVANHTEGRPVLFGDANRVRAIEVQFNPAAITPLTGLKIKITLMGDSGENVIWDDYVFEKDHLVVVRKMENNKLSVSHLYAFFADNRLKPNLDDYLHCVSSQRDLERLGFIVENDTKRWRRIKVINNLDRTIRPNGEYVYHTAKVESWVDVNGDEEMLIPQKEVFRSLSQDETDRINNQYPMMRGRF